MSFSHHFGESDEDTESGRSIASLAGHIWLFALAISLIPSLAAWALRATAYAASCAPQAKPCFAPPFGAVFGAAFKGLLDLAWIMGAHPMITTAVTLLAGIAAVIAIRPIGAAFTVLVLPIAALLLPVGLVNTTLFDGCVVNEAGAGDCVLWGTPMGMSFHIAATAPDLVSNYAPLAVSGALVAGLLGWIVHWGCRQMKKKP